MTIEEAVEILKGAIKKPNTTDGYLGQALDMAIKALEQEPCNDCISRQAVLDKEKYWIAIKETETGIIEKRGYFVLDDDVKELPSVTPQPTRWIPVSERLPEDKINPLTEDFYEYPVTVEIRGKRDVRYYKFGKPIGWDEPHWFFGSGIMDDFVIAWMPLPEPYKEAENEDCD